MLVVLDLLLGIETRAHLEALGAGLHRQALARRETRGNPHDLDGLFTREAQALA